MATDRFINVENGGKKSTDHTQVDSSKVSGNYGVYAGRGLVLIDIDDYNGSHDLAPINGLQDTLTIGTPNGGEHRYYHIPNAADVFEDAFGVKNPVPEWGEVRVHNQYVVGPGSTNPDGDTRDGYVIAENRPVAQISAHVLVGAIRATGYDTTDDTTETDSDESDVPTVDVSIDDAELLEKAKNADNGDKFNRLWRGDTSDHKSQSEADLALCNHLAFWTGNDRSRIDSLFRQSGLNREKWNNRDDYRERTLDKALDGRTDFYEPSGAKATGGGVATAETRDSDLPIPSAFDVHNGGYAKYHPPRDDDGNGYYERITNFQIETLSRLTHDDDTREFHLRVHPAGGESYTVTCEPVVLNDLPKFRRGILDGWTTTFDGSQDDLNRLKEFVGNQQTKHRTGTKLLGLHGDEWVTPDGSLTTDGWTDDPDTVFTDVDTPLATAFNLKPSRGDEYDRDAVREILRLFPQTRTKERFLPVIGWFYAAPFRPHIQQWEGEFNILNILGDTGSGKTTTLETLWQAFGVDEELLEAKATPFSIMRMIASSNAVPVLLDEYKPSEIGDYELNKLHSNLRASTRGGVVTKGRPDMGVDKYHLKAPVCISGEQPIQGPAEERRTILTVFKRDVTVGETPEQEAFARLVGGEANGKWYDGYDLTDHALAYYRWVLQQDPDELHGLWKNSRHAVMDLLAGTEYTGLDDMVIQGFQTIKFGCTLYRAFADEMGLDPDETPVTSDAINQAIHYVADGGTGAEHTSHLDRLLGIMGRAASAGYLEENGHYKVVNQGGPNAELAIHLDTAFDKVRKYARDHDVRGDDLLSSSGDYKARIEDAADDPESYIAACSQNTPPLNRCVRIHIADATELVGGFEPEPFGANNDSDDEKASTRFDPVSIHDVAKDPTGYPTVEGEIATIDYPENDDAPAVAATLVDGSAAIDVVSWDDGSCLEQGEQVIIENARTSEFNGTTQLVVKGGVTSIHEAPSDGQSQIDDPDNGA
ncbi:phage NrS-1 polymerase family protein [Natronorubrum daqingense]|uniref:phage NrS-1 polymerase family protein n=1 Tax=Natronorubrum daqingense TaxID=588898 RepID=UPI001439F09A|nr:bifunctional DNA primase/polymerase [Natronorubrum daqingense]